MEDKKKGQEISCALQGSKLCPHPNSCDGLKRMCNLWQTHSGK